MAEVNVVNRTHTMDANDTYIIKWGQLERRPYTLIMHIEDSGSDDGQYTVHARPQGSTAAFLQIPYQSLHLNGAVGTGALVSTTITGDSQIAVVADGMEVALIRASGSTSSSVLTLGLSSLAS